MAKTPNGELIPKLHILPQIGEHCEVLIIGDRDGLRVLRDTISAALDNLNPEKHESDDVFADDGEGYHVIVERRDVDLDTDLGGHLPYASLRDWRNI